MTLNAGFSSTLERGISKEDQELIDIFLSKNSVTVLEPFASNKEGIKLKFEFTKRRLKSQTSE